MATRERLEEIVRAHAPIGLTTSRFEALLAARRVDASDLEDERLSELYLAFACAEGDEAAVTAFTQGFGGLIHQIARKAIGDASADDVVQRFLTHFLVSDGEEPPRIAKYQGSGTLRGFVRMASSRFAIDALRSERVRQSPPPVEGSDSVDTIDVLALDAVRERMGYLLGDALRALKPMERRVLRLRFVLGFSVRRTAQALGVHENSVPRLVARARQRLLEHVQQDPEMPSHPSGLVAAAQVLDVSVSRYLQSNPGVGTSSDT